MSKSHESSINVALAEVLQNCGKSWSMHPEPVGQVFGTGGRPDILVDRSDGWPVIIEAEVGNHSQAEAEARSRLSKTYSDRKRSVHAAVAVVYPPSLRNYSGAKLREAIQNSRLEYALFIARSKDSSSVTRFPEHGWINGTLAELSIVLHRCSIPTWRVSELAERLERDVAAAANETSIQHPVGTRVGSDLAEVFDQPDDSDGQTRRMAMTALVSALIFHMALYEAELKVPAKPERNLLHPEQMKSSGYFIRENILEEWSLVLNVNYWPIFHTASEVVRAMPVRLTGELFGFLWKTAQALIAGGVTQSHDLTGIVFQRLVADRKFLATYYTMPSSAALLAAIAMPVYRPVTEQSWADPGILKSIRIADFACGTGTLLSTAYQRITLLHQIHGGDPRAIHPNILEHGLVGLDVLTVAVHLTATMLAGTYPDTPFTSECLLTMPYGMHEWGASLGSLDLLDDQIPLEMITAAAEKAGGRGRAVVKSYVEQLGHGQFDLVIMNPPFTRHGAREGDRSNVRNPAFAAFQASEDTQRVLERRMKLLARNSVGHGHAGMASFFVDLAHRKTRVGGTVALVLPLTALSGKSWEKVRELWRTQYEVPILVTIAGDSSFNRSFSNDTGMAECLFVGRKAVKLVRRGGRANFAILHTQPSDTVECEQIAQTISETIDGEDIRQLEDGPFGGTPITVGSTKYGEIVGAQLPISGPWPLAGIRDITLGQTAHQLSEGRLWVDGMSPTEICEISTCTVEPLTRSIGPHDLDLTGSTKKAEGLPQGPFEKIKGCSAGDSYPALWSHHSKRERSMLIEPDCHLVMREVNGGVPLEIQNRAAQRWQYASNTHYNRNLQFNSQSTVAVITKRPSLGGPAWPALLLNDPSWNSLFVLWCNSTLGLLCHWWMSNKTQSGRGVVTITAISDLCTVDLSKVSPQRVAAAQDVLNDMGNERLLPFDQINMDSVREILDRRLLIDVLGLPSWLCDQHGPIYRLREKLAAEPQIHADKRSMVAFTEDGESTMSRSARK